MIQSAHAATMVLPEHGLTRYLHVRITTDDRAMVIEHRRALLGLIPLWRRRVEVPLAMLASAGVRTFIRPDCAAAALGLAALVLLTGWPVLVDVLLVMAAIGMVMLAIDKALRVERTDGRSWRFLVCWGHAFDASLAAMDAEQRRDTTRPRGPTA